MYLYLACFDLSTWFTALQNIKNVQRKIVAYLVIVNFYGGTGTRESIVVEKNV